MKSYIQDGQLFVAPEEGLLHRVNKELVVQKDRPRNYLLKSKWDYMLIKHHGFDVVYSTDDEISLSTDCFIKFPYDDELKSHLVQSSGEPLRITTTPECNSALEVLKGKDLISERISGIVGVQFDREVCKPFLAKKATDFLNERKEQKPLANNWHRQNHRAIVDSAKVAKNKSFLYIAGDQSIRILCVYLDRFGNVARTSNGGIGSVVESLFLSLTNLGEKESVQFGNEDFLFPQATRGNGTWTDVLETDPEFLFITSNAKQAVLHIQDTKFASFAHLVSKYSELCERVAASPSAVRSNPYCH